MISQNRFYWLSVCLQNRLCILLACFALAGCVGKVTAEQMPHGITELRYTETDQPGGDGPFGWVQAAQTRLTNEAVKACPNGFTKLNERVIPGDLNTTVWQIRCTQNVYGFCCDRF